ncbi:MAG: heat-shock protein Hsp20 [Variovorax sp.]|nr:heat-shock protein Hsp20 [Variovorax sp.]
MAFPHIRDRLQRDMQQAFDPSPRAPAAASRRWTSGALPRPSRSMPLRRALTDALEVSPDRNVLTIDGTRSPLAPEPHRNAAIHINERFEGPFRRVIPCPKMHPTTYRDGVLRITVQRRASTQPRRIATP